MSQEIERERLDVDILFVGAGAATLAAVIRLADLCRASGSELPSVLVIEKASQIGGHQLSGAVIDPRAIRELFPDFMEQGFPLQHECTRDAVYFLTKNRALRSPLTPPMLANHGNLVVSLSDLVKWLGGKAEERGIEIYPGFAALRPLFDGNRVVGVQIQDQGVGRDGQPKAVFEPGPEIHARVVVFGEGPRGSCSKEVVEKLGLQGEVPQSYETGVKEIWRVLPENHVPGRVIHTLFWPLDAATFGGSWLYDMKDGLVSLGFATSLNYTSPYTDPHDNMQRWKLHPFIRSILEGGECIRYGAKTLPAGGLRAMPRLVAEGVMLVGDSAGFCNAGRLKGVHMALKSGMLAAEALHECIRSGDFSAAALEEYPRRFRSSWAYDEHRQYRNFHASFEWTRRLPRALGWLRQAPWLLNVGALAPLTGGRGLADNLHVEPDHAHIKKLDQLDAYERSLAHKVAYDNKYTFDKVTAVNLAGSAHEPDQPHHLKVSDTNVCATQCAQEYGNPCENFCPAAVYEMIDDPAAPRGRSLVIHHENCVHCKTCDVADPYQIITWTTPQGGEGPDYTQM
jgi:electron-transferring-flavoprotein dehydrogenase